jgi:hypothetical protein
MSYAEETSELLDWTSADMHVEFADGAMLVIAGETPVPEKVFLQPLPIEMEPVEYQGIELRGSRDKIAPDHVTPFRFEIEDKRLPKGTVGFELIGKTKHEFFPPKEE